jgi:hypothetical protein
MVDSRTYHKAPMPSMRNADWEQLSSAAHHHARIMEDLSLAAHKAMEAFDEVAKIAGRLHDEEAD